MKYLFAIIGLIFWCLFIFLMTISLIGFFIIAEQDDLMEIPRKLINVFEK